MTRKLTVPAGAVILAGSLALAQSAATTPATTHDAASRPFTLSKETTAITAPLRSDGTPDYVAALNQKYGRGVTPENNGFVVYLRIVGADNALSARVRSMTMVMCGVDAQVNGAAVWEKDDRFTILTDGVAPRRGELEQAMLAVWKAQEHPEVFAYLNAREKQLDHALIAAERPRWWVPYVSTGHPEMMSLSLPSLGPAREMADALCARALLRAGDGDLDGFIRHTMAAKHLARQVGGGATLIERLIGIAIDAQSSMTIGAALGTGTWTQEQIQRLRKIIAELPPLPAPSEALDTGERWVMLDAITYMSLQKSGMMGRGGDGTGPRFDTIDQKSMRYDLVLKLANNNYDELLAAMREPLIPDMQARIGETNKRNALWSKQAAERNSGSLAKQSDESDDAYSERVGRAIVAFLAPIVGRSQELYRMSDVQESMLNALLAAAEVKAVSKSWPRTLNDLVPQYLKEVPKDIYSKSAAEQVKYHATTNGARLYSIGPNGQDDGGVLALPQKDDIGVGVAR